MIDEILPPEIQWAETFTQELDLHLWPEEEAGLGQVASKRRREFTNGRACARIALRRLGLPAVAVPRGPNREPQWPAGIVGSIAHCEGYCAAATGYGSHFATIGIDAEINSALPEGVLDEISSVGEQRLIGRLASIDRGVAWDRLLFSAKESVYKAWYPITHTWLDFEDAQIEIDPNAPNFVAILSRPGLQVFSGRWLARDGLVLTAIAARR